MLLVAIFLCGHGDVRVCMDCEVEGEQLSLASNCDSYLQQACLFKALHFEYVHGLSFTQVLCPS